MTRRQELIRGAIAVVVFAAVLVLTSRCQASGFNARTAEILDENDSLRATIAIREALNRESARRIIALAIERNAAQDSARRANAEANRLRAQRPRIVPVASQPGTAPTVSDTLAAVESQLDNCEAETVALRAVIVQDSIALAKSTAAQAEQAGQLANRDSSIVELRGQVDKLERQLIAADPPCRVLFFPCPSRTTVAIGSAVAATVVTLSLTRK